jgi:hypothetical protein
MPRNNRTRLRQLRELIEALDRRVPRVERVGEAAITKDAAVLRKRALERIAELECRAPTKARPSLVVEGSGTKRVQGMSRWRALDRRRFPELIS